MSPGLFFQGGKEVGEEVYFLWYLSLDIYKIFRLIEAGINLLTKTVILVPRQRSLQYILQHEPFSLYFSL